MSYDREQTQRRLVEAVGTVLARDGFAGLGVNAVAREAGVNKALVYRYFGGFDQLMRAYAQGQGFWPSLEEWAGEPLERFRRRSLEERATRVVVNHGRALRRRPLTLEILAWENIERNELTAVLEEVREVGQRRLVAELLPELVDDEAVLAVGVLITAATQYLLVRSRQVRLFSGFDLRSEVHWQRLEQAMGRMVRATIRSRRRQPVR